MVEHLYSSIYAIEVSNVDRRTFISTAALCIASVLAGCSTETEQSDSNAQEKNDPQLANEPSSVTNSVDSLDGMPFAAADTLKGLSEVQRNSINMLNYLAVLVQQITESKNSRLLLEDIYSNLINNVSPDAVDGETLNQIKDILDDLEQYRMLSTKRERLQLIYNRAQAEAIKSAVPNPLALLSAVQANNLADLAISVVYMAVDSATSYSSAMSAAETECMQTGWDLDDAESETIHSSRKQMFSYAVNTVSEYGLPGSLALTEEAVDQFVTWENAKLANRIRFFEKEAETYCAVGEYWLLLARSYQENGDTAKCIKAIETYEELSTGILRKDSSFAKTLSVALSAIASAEDGSLATYGGHWIEELLRNCPKDDWSLRYFGAQAYVAMARETSDMKYLELAYETALDNVNELIPEQRALNSSYLAPIVKVDGASGLPWASPEEKEKESYNKMLEDERKVALAPLYEPLLINLELLKAIEDDHPDAVGKTSVEEIIHSDGRLFLVDCLDERYTEAPQVTEDESISYDCNEIRLPAKALTAQAEINVKICSDNEEHSIDDWILDAVERVSDADQSTFTAVYTSELAKEIDYKDGMTVQLTVSPCPDKDLPVIEATFRATGTKVNPWDNLAVWDDGYEFERI